MNKYAIICYLIFIFIILGYCFADDVYVKLLPEEEVSDGDIVKFNISVENIPKIGTFYYNDIKDGGCRGVDVYIKFPDNLKPYGFVWSDLCKNEKLKSYEFKNNNFTLHILFNNPIENDFTIGEILFIPVKKGEAYINLSGSVSSANGFKYGSLEDYYDYSSQTFKKYPKIKFFGAKVIIKGIKNVSNTSTMKLKEDTSELENIGGGSSTVINRIYITPNIKEPKVIVKEINITEYKPIVKVIIEKKSNFGFFGLNIFSGILTGIFFGLILFGVNKI